MKRLVIGILAHVDSGKTTLSEGLLYAAGAIGRLGRVDHRDAFLDTNQIERDRGITIFSKQAMLNFGKTEFTLLDTPGHIDFSAEMERTLQVLDYAILVISGSDGVQSHTETLWKLLCHYGIPTFLFVNKMDLVSADKAAVLSALQSRLSDCCIDFSRQDAVFFENTAVCDNAMLEEYMQTEAISDKTISEAILSRKIFPCFFGSALKNEGVKEFLENLDRYTIEKSYRGEFGAKVFKIAEDEKGKRLTYLKITGGSLKARDLLCGSGWTEKVNELRIYSGAKYKNIQEAHAGCVCAVTGLSKTFPGEGLGIEHNSGSLMQEPVFTYAVKLADGADMHHALSVFKKLQEEETQLNIVWNERAQEISVQVMGAVQLEVLKRILKERFQLDADFERGSIIYKETIQNTVEGVGHYEPLRHYAEVHLLLEPGKRGSGLVFQAKCSEDVLDKNWQRLILTHLAEKTHLGVLTGSPITDMKITLVNGKAHIKHTEGGDFRQATYRAVRQGLMQAESILLEPWYDFTLELPTETVGRAMTDLQQMGSEFKAPEASGEMSVICGSAPVSAMQDYHAELTAYTRGRGRLSCSLSGYNPCQNQQEIIEKIGYDCNSDAENIADSVFCSHGSGYIVKWNDVFSQMHLPLQKSAKAEPESAPMIKKAQQLIADEEELLRIFEMTYGNSGHKSLKPMRTQKNLPVAKPKAKTAQTAGSSYLLIDGYNIIFAWEELKEIAQESLEHARELFIDRLCNYQAMKQNNVILVFDAYKVKGSHGEVEKKNGITIVYTKEAETADAYIEKATHQLCKNHRVRVATSDNLEQMIIFGYGARRVSAPEFQKEVNEVEEEIRTFLRENTDTKPKG